MKNKFTYRLLSSALLLAFASPLPAGVILGWDGADNDGEGIGVIDHNAEYADANLVSTPVTLGSGLNVFSESAADTRVGGINKNASVADLPDDDYISFTVAPQSGARFTLDATDSIQLGFNQTTGGNYSTEGNDIYFHLRSSVDNFASDLDTLTFLGDADLNFSVGSGFTNVTQSTEFRIYFTEGPQGGLGYAPRFFLSRTFSAGEFDELDAVINGSTVPEPSTFAAIFGVLALGLALIRRRKS